MLVAFGRMVGPLDEREPTLLEEPIERRYAVRQVRTRMHQSRFRAAVLPAYRERCSMCRLKEVRLLDAAHIVGDLEERGDAVVANGLCLCSIHHRAFDENLVGVSPDYEVHVSPGSSTTRTVRCSSSSKASTASHSASREAPGSGRIATGSPSATSASWLGRRSRRDLRLRTRRLGPPRATTRFRR